MIKKPVHAGAAVSTEDETTPKGTFRHGPNSGARLLSPVPYSALDKLDAAATLLAEAAGLMLAAEQDMQDGRAVDSGVWNAAEIIVANRTVRECAAKLAGVVPEQQVQVQPTPSQPVFSGLTGVAGVPAPAQAGSGRALANIAPWWPGPLTGRKL